MKITSTWSDVLMNQIFLENATSNEHRIERRKVCAEEEDESDK